MKKLTIIIPCHNEEKGLVKVLSTIPITSLKKLGILTKILVIDNNSTDNTAKVAKQFKAEVIFEHKKGKGHAIMTGFRSIDFDTDFIVMLDGDGTYAAKEVLRMIEPLLSDFCDVVVGSRLGGDIKKDSLKFQNRIVNWSYTFLVRQFYQANVTDVLSGYFSWKKEVIDSMFPHLQSEGFELEMDMITKMKRLGFRMYSVPITYEKRHGESKISAVSDGLRILHVFSKNLFWSPSKSRKNTRRLIPTVTSI